MQVGCIGFAMPRQLSRRDRAIERVYLALCSRHVRQFFELTGAPRLPAAENGRLKEMAEAIVDLAFPDASRDA